MDITGKITEILPEQRFSSKRTGQEYVRYGFVLETGGAYPKKVKFDVLGEDQWGKMLPYIQSSMNGGTDCTVSFDVNSRLWKGKWYTTVSAWKVFGGGAGNNNSNSNNNIADDAPY